MNRHRVIRASFPIPFLTKLLAQNQTFLPTPRDLKTFFTMPLTPPAPFQTLKSKSKDLRLGLRIN